MNDNDKNIAKEILFKMMDLEIGEFFHESKNCRKSLTTDVVTKSYQNILKLISNQE
jgi:hypothetical protein